MRLPSVGADNNQRVKSSAHSSRDVFPSIHVNIDRNYVSIPRRDSFAYRAVPLWDSPGVFYPTLDVPEHVALDAVAVQKEVEPFSPNGVIALLQVCECSMGLNALLSPFLE